MEEDLKRNECNNGRGQTASDRLEDWLNCKNVTEILLIATNLILMLKTGSNLFNIVFHSPSDLLVDYMGYFNMSESDGSQVFKFCFILTNLSVFFLSCLCVFSLCFVEKTSELRGILIYHFVRFQLVLAIVVMIFMAILWFDPIRLRLDEDEWKKSIIHYNYHLEPDSNGLLPSSGPDYDGYTTRVDQIQQALGCCGYSSPGDWKQLNGAALIAPSCCKNPIAIDVETFIVSSSANSPNNTSQKHSRMFSDETTKKDGDSLLQSILPNVILLWIQAGTNGDNPRQSSTKETFFYCQASSWALQRWPLSDLQEFGLGPAGVIEPLGCSRLLANREVLLTFNLRLTLLLLFGAQVLLMLAALSLSKPLRKSSQHQHHHQQQQQQQQQERKRFYSSDWFTFKYPLSSEIKPTQLSDWIHGHSNHAYLHDSSFSKHPNELRNQPKQKQLL